MGFETAHVAMCTDGKLVEYVEVLLRSITKNTSVQVCAHIVVDIPETRYRLQRQLSHLLEEQINLSCDFVTFGGFDEGFLESNMRVVSDHPTDHAYMQNSMNFARLYLGELLPGEDKVLYLDIDTIVQGDIWQLFRVELGDEYPMAACPNYVRPFDQEMLDLNLLASHPRYDREYHGFNAGVMLANLAYWRKSGIAAEAKNLMVAHKNSESGLFRFGTQAILNILFYQKYLHLDGAWNLLLSRWTETTKKQLESAKIIHWKGPRKPWHEQAEHKEYWERYRGSQTKHHPLDSKTP